MEKSLIEVGRFKYCILPVKILVSAWELSQQEGLLFTKESLIVWTWKNFPQDFGLKKFEEKYPCSNRVMVSVYNAKGPIKHHQWLAIKDEMVSLTGLGSDLAQELLYPNKLLAPEDSARNKKLDRFWRNIPEPIRWLLRKLLTPTAQKYRYGGKDEVGLNLACKFWEIRSKDKDWVIDKKLKAVEAMLANLSVLLADGPFGVGHNRTVGIADADFIRNAHKYFLATFARSLKLQKIENK